MSTLRRKPLLVVIAVLALSWLVLSPYIVLWQISNAAKSGNTDSIAALVDFPAVRTSIKDSLMAAVTKSAAESAKSPSGSSSIGAGLGLMFAGPMINSMVDGMVTPQGVSTMIKTGKIPDPTQAASVQESSTAPSPAPQFDTHYVSFDRFAVNVSASGQKSLFEARLCRVNLFGWKLCSVDVNLPSTNT